MASKVLVAMSGGVDSSVAAALLLRQGYEVVGCFMRLGSPGDTLDELIPDAKACDRPTPARVGHRGCCSITDAADARLVAAQLGIPLYVCNFKREFGRVIDYFVGEYAAGRTPNPCVRCNDWLKFGKLHEYAAQIGADFVASGHYARIGPGDAGPRLMRGVDRSKDQSYVLFGVPRALLGRMLLPVGQFEKAAVRQMARRFGLPVFDKPDSQEICFIPDDDYAGFVEQRRPDLAAVGAVVDTAGKVLGEHAGQHRFTVGQRRGVRVASSRRLYVIGKDAETNTVTIGGPEALLTSSCIAGEANWLIEAPCRELRCHAVHRYNGRAVPVRLRPLPAEEGPTPSGRAGRFEVTFDEPQRAVAPGQAIVLYDADAVLGGGWIRSAG